VIEFGSSFTPWFAIAFAIWLISFLVTPLALPVYLAGKLERRNFLVFVSVEVLVYAAWLILLYFEGSLTTPPLFNFTYWLPSTASATFGYLYAKKSPD